MRRFPRRALLLALLFTGAAQAAEYGGQLEGFTYP